MPQYGSVYKWGEEELKLCLDDLRALKVADDAETSLQGVGDPLCVVRTVSESWGNLDHNFGVCFVRG